MYMTSGKYRKSSSQSINESALMMVANWTVVIATIMSMMKAVQHNVDISPMMSRQPQMNSTDETKYAMTCGKGIPPGTDDRFVHELVLTGDEKLVSSGDSEEYSK